MTSIYKAALQYARKGIPVFPCDENKRPMTPNGFHAATTDEDRIRGWFDSDSPPLIGIPTGKVSGLWIFDVDMKNGHDGQAELDKLLAENGQLPDTPMSLTPSGGWHYAFKWTEQVQCSAGKIAPGLDVRGDGGYFVAPPSKANGRSYEWEASSGTENGLAEAPEWLLAKVRPPAKRERRPYQEPTDSERKRALAALRCIKYDGQSRDQWVEIGMAYAAAGGDFGNFDAWCQEQPGYDADSVEKEWNSFDPEGGITPGTLYHYAKQHGWRDGPELRFSKRAAPEEARPELEMRKNKAGEDVGVVPSVANVAIVFEHSEEYAGRLLFNELTGAVELVTKGGVKDLTDSLVNEMRVWLDTAVKWAGKPSKAHAFDAVDVVARRHSYHPVRDYLSSLQWDGCERLAHWLEDVCGVPRSAYTMAVASKTLLGAVARVFEPGCKLDTMTVLIGPQGILKSTLVRNLFGWHSDTPILLGSKDAYQALKGAWCYEFAELASFHGKEVEKLKAFFSSATDHYRESYGRIAESHPRQCVFVATTNDDAIFHDATGSRRFWPVRVDSVDLEALRLMRDQLWAEAVHAYHAGEVWHMEGEAQEEAAQAAEEHYAADPWEEKIARFCADREWVKTADILDFLEIPMDRRTRGDVLRVVRILTSRWGYQHKSIREGNKVFKAYSR